VLIVQQPSIFILSPSSNIFTRQEFQYVSTGTFSIKSTKIPITYPAPSTTKIGATVTMLTSIIEGCTSGSFEATNCLEILSRIPVSRNCANLWRKLYYFKGLIHGHFKRILTKTLQL